MSEALRDLEVLALDCQASGATPEYGDLLELGWAPCRAAGALTPAKSTWIVPRTERRIGRAVRELTGWSEACVSEALDEREVWAGLREVAKRLSGALERTPTVIHFARFELAFLRDLHERLGDGGDFPFDPICLHAIAARLFPDLPRRNIRALSGFLGYSPALERRSAGHVEATVQIWHALVPRLEQAGLGTWNELKDWLEQSSPAARSRRRVYPLAVERRRALPDRAGVYRFLRSNGDVLYVGKAANLRKRVAGHFRGGRGPLNERALELLSQVHDIDHTPTATVLEAALLETDEIKRLNPPYNVQLRSDDRRAWFAASDFAEALSVPDGAHRVGPLPSQRALSPLRALVRLAGGAEATPELTASALAVPSVFAPDAALFLEGWRGFAADLLLGDGSAGRRVTRASLALWLERGRAEAEPGTEDAAPHIWDMARVRRRLERSLVQTGLLLRRSRWLCLLADATIVFREPAMDGARALLLSNGEIVERLEVGGVADIRSLPLRRPRSLLLRQTGFEIATYDRLRVLLTELGRVRAEGGEIALSVGRHHWAAERLAELMRGV